MNKDIHKQYFIMSLLGCHVGTLLFLPLQAPPVLVVACYGIRGADHHPPQHRVDLLHTPTVQHLLRQAAAYLPPLQPAQSGLVPQQGVDLPGQKVEVAVGLQRDFDDLLCFVLCFF